MINDYLTIKQVANHFNISDRAIQKMISANKVSREYIKEEPNQLGGGKSGTIYKVCPLGMPEPYRSEWVQEQTRREVSSSKELLYDWQQDKAEAKLMVVQYLEREIKQADRNGDNITPVYDEVTEIYNTGKVLPTAYETMGEITVHTIKKWRKQYTDALKSGDNILKAMAPKPRKKRGTTSVPKWMQDQLKALLLHPNRITSRHAYRLIESQVRRSGKEIPVSFSTAHRWVKRFKKKHYDLWTLAREGQKALNDKVLPYIKRDWNLLNVGDVLVADGHVVNFDVKHPVTGRAHRPTLIVFMDGRSRYPVGVSMMPTENIDVISEALMDGIRFMGKFPQAVILDNGRAFKSNHFTHIQDFGDTRLPGIYERYGIQTHFTKPYHGQSKHVERFFGTMDKQFSRMMPTWRGDSIENKSPRLMRNEVIHKKAYDKTVGDWLPTIPEVLNTFKAWAKEAYGMQTHSGLNRSETPYSVVNAERGDGIPEHLLFDLMLRAKTIRPRRAQFTIEGITYSNWDLLTGINHQVTVRYSRTMPEHVFVFDPTAPNGEEFICKAEAVEAAHPLVSLTDDEGKFKQNIREKLNERKKIEKRVKQALDMERAFDNTLPDPGGLTQIDIPTDELPDATPKRLKLIEFDPEEEHYSPNLEDNTADDTPLTPTGRPLFEADYQRFEWLMKHRDEINEKDITFLHDFTTTPSYKQMYEAEYGHIVNELLNN